MKDCKEFRGAYHIKKNTEQKSVAHFVNSYNVLQKRKRKKDPETLLPGEFKCVKEILLLVLQRYNFHSI